MRKTIFQIFLGLFFATCAIVVQAAIPYKQAGQGKKDIYVENGVFTGGVLKGTVSLLGIRRILSQNTGIDRWIIDLGDAVGAPLAERPSYFHIAVDREQKRVVIDLQNVASSKLDEDQIRAILKQSPYVRGADLRVDGAKRMTHLTVFLKQEVEVEAFELPAKEKGGRIAMDVRPVRQAKK
jgi:hypothetical protein